MAIAATLAPSGGDMELQPWLCDATEMPLVHEGQALRLCLRTCVPEEVKLGDWFEVAVGCRNEFGLWKRDEFPCTGSHIPLAVSAVGLSGHALGIETKGQLALDASGKLEFTASFVINSAEEAHSGSILFLRIAVF